MMRYTVSMNTCLEGMSRMDARAVLRQYFGHDSFRAGQEELIAALIRGRDALGVMPTGAGKSICYQVPALMAPGLTIVVSPLISLMKDQVAALIQAGVPAAYINSSLTPRQISLALERAAQGRYKIIYVAPERLGTPEFRAFAQRASISLVAVDEAHCVSQWGQDFRPSYLEIADFLGALNPRPPVGAFTATATARVREDIVRLLQLRDPVAVTTGFDRPNLYFDVLEPEDRLGWIVDYVRAHEGGSGIVYCLTRKAVEQTCGALVAAGVRATRYHAGLDDEERRKNQDDFTFDRVDVIVATNAFGMGIDKSNVSYVLHEGMPKNLESYYQEAGRAGRDGERAECILLFSPKDVITARYFIEHGEDNPSLNDEERALVRREDLRRLNQMIDYCYSTTCLRAAILSYFGEKAEAPCGNCGVCLGRVYERDMTGEAHMIVMAMKEILERFPYGVGASTVSKALRGSNCKTVRERGLDHIKSYGLLCRLSRDDMGGLLNQLIDRGLLTEFGDYHVLRIGRPFEKDEKIMLRMRSREEWRAERQERKAARSEKCAGRRTLEVDPNGLYAALKSLRAELAQKEGVPAFVIFSNATLEDMARRCPRTEKEFMAVSGVGQYKASRYAEEFLAAISDWEARRN